MRTCLSWVLGVTLSVVMVYGGNITAENRSGVDKVKVGADYKLSGPYACQNLSVFLVHGKAGIKGKRIISLSEALNRGVVTIDETGEVNRLSATNHSDTEFVFIQSGDIVKGGRQDRTLSKDALLPPKSKKVPLNSFCVEQGRWHKRGAEKIDKFASAKKRISSKQLKLAVKKNRSQREVWNAVAAEQERLGRKIGKSVRKPASATSLQLSLEDEDVEKRSRAYQKVLLPVGQGDKDAIGFAFAVNGRFNTADIYGDPELFQKLWPKLIETAAYEAISQFDEKKAITPANTSDVRDHIMDALHSRKVKEASSDRTRLMTGETKHNYAFETKDEMGQIIHINIIKK